jgi:hypothetical protein
VKVALFTSPGGYITAYNEESGKAMVEYQRYTQTSEYVDVEFPPLPTEVIVEGQLKQLDEAEKDLRNQFQQKLNELAETRAKLLSLSHETQA